ncbi:MAG TPA: large conductance mechanosensitive channel protein MscL [Vicinamibacterales bacterium]|nr:large conductance mechanosensitive channel protein MscL [Vicinamibacterales bacterium]
MLREFREFISRGNVIDLAVAVVIGAAFIKIVNTFVEGVLMPPLGLLISGADLSAIFYVLDTSRGIPESLADAKVKGIPVIAYGQLMMDVIQFLIIAFVVFLLVRTVNRLKSHQAGEAGPTTRECPQCLSSIPLKAVRCAHCTSVLQG